MVLHVPRHSGETEAGRVKETLVLGSMQPYLAPVGAALTGCGQGLVAGAAVSCLSHAQPDPQSGPRQW